MNDPHAKALLNGAAWNLGAEMKAPRPLSAEERKMLDLAHASTGTLVEVL